ncbi:5'/3'-nucleotidase SurE [Isoalcanivorax beigongshangi]|uniref:5'-nucleotidase SurE n=1 Tax=Isoalcanivorax beigongshangi TaxID=3238810 RepID=A0ABV4AIC1_9GAMM
MSSSFLFQRVLVTNDDGIDAPGLAVAAAIAAELAAEVWVVAPEHDQSGVAQAISLHQPLRCYPRGERRYALSGTPADCVLYAMAAFFDGAPPDLVLSGVNCGANVSDAVMYSGTVGAALAAAHLGVPAVALSQSYEQREQIDWSPARQHAAALVRTLVAQQGGERCWNINFPAAPAPGVPIRITRQLRGSVPRPGLKHGTDGRGLPYQWLTFRRDPQGVTAADSDVVALEQGCIAVMPLQTSRCDQPLVDALRAAPALFEQD